MKKLVTLLIAATPALLLAQGFQVNLQGQRQQGMGGAGTAFMQDGAALFFNPGGMSFVKGSSVNVGVSPTIAHAVFRDEATGNQSETTSGASYPFTAYGVFGCDSSKHKVMNDLKFGIGVYTPFGSTITWEDNWTGRFALTSLSLTSVFIQPTVSYKITDKLGLGAGFVYGIGHVNLKKDIPVMDANGNYGKAELDGNANGFGFNAGIYFQPVEKFSVALSYRSQVNMKVEGGDATFTVPSSLASNFPNGDFSASLPLPQVATLGLMFKPVPKLTLALDVNFVGWKAYDTLAFDYETNTSTLEDTKEARMYENSFAFRLGAQYAITESFDARLGIAYGITPIQDGYVTPETPDANRLNLAAGLGYKFGQHFAADASFTYEHLERTDSNKSSNLSGTYKTYVFIPGLSIAYKF